MKIDEAVEILWQAKQKGDHAPEALRKALTLEDAYHVQLGMLARYCAAGEKQAGWKIGATSDVARKMLNVSAPVWGYLLESRRFAGGHSFQHETIGKPVIESELCITIGQRLAGPGVTRDQVLAAVSSVAPAFEIAEMRSDMAADLPLGVADDVAQWGYVIGAIVSPYPKDLDLGEIMVEMRKNGELVQQVRGKEAIDDQLESIALLANSLAPYGRALDAGQCIITGTVTKPLPIGQGGRRRFPAWVRSPPLSSSRLRKSEVG
jgi:2-keto-4-pentenoate hydratase